MTQEMNEHFDMLAAILTDASLPLPVAYRLLRDMLEQLCRSQLADSTLQMTDLSARINHMAARVGLSMAEQNRLHTIRLTANDLLNGKALIEDKIHRDSYAIPQADAVPNVNPLPNGKIASDGKAISVGKVASVSKSASDGKIMSEGKPLRVVSREHLLRDVKSMAFLLRRIFQVDIPSKLYQLLPREDATWIQRPPAARRVKQMRVSFEYADEQFLYVRPTDCVDEEHDYWQVRYHVPDINQEFDTTCELLWRHAQLNLLDVDIDAEGVLTPMFIILEPDYLIDISALAECFREYGHHPANYLFARLRPQENTKALLLGNIANLFLDEWVHATDGAPDYLCCMRKAFRMYALELTSCPDLQDPQVERQFFADCKEHFLHIGQTVSHTFREAGIDLDKSKAILEPSYICEALGLQGRLDYMQSSMEAFIEMKSGKADEYALRGRVEPKENHRVQMTLYQAVLEYSMGMDHRLVKPYLLYTRYPLLYPARPSWALLRRVMDLRNRIVEREYGVQLRNSASYTAEVLSDICPTVMNEKQLSGTFWTRYILPSISEFSQRLSVLNEVEKAYFYTLYNFITKELYTAKSGDCGHEGCFGAASLWRSTLQEKEEAGEILHSLTLVSNEAADEENPFVILQYLSPVERTGSSHQVDHFQSVGSPLSADSSRLAADSQSVGSPLSAGDPKAIPNFRPGDAVLLYERNTPEDNVTRRMVVKANIEEISVEVKPLDVAASQNLSSNATSENLSSTATSENLLSAVAPEHALNPAGEVREKSEQYVEVMTLRLRLRASQQNPMVFPPDSHYAIEQDATMDSSFRSMYQSLSLFLTAPAARRNWLLGKSPSRFDTSYDEAIASTTDDFERIALKAESAQDCFLLVGPPGTGKTSRALKRMVERFLAKGYRLLLLSYTNRAVDEMCKSLSTITPAVDYIRIGSELSCEEPWRPHLLKHQLSTCNNRREVAARLQRCPVFVGTVASLSTKNDLFRLLRFDVAIVDEATQILEPQLLGLLCACDSNGGVAIGKFVLIGDHKQLPAVVLQHESQSEVVDESLQAIGMYNLKDSLFERLYRHLKLHPEQMARGVDMLCRQGRMNPIVADFPNKAFYEGRLQPVGLEHQKGQLQLAAPLANSALAPLLVKRVAFIASRPEPYTSSCKVNHDEASIVARIAEAIYYQYLYTDGFDESHTLGIIAPYRSQVALIRAALERLGIEPLRHVMVDTVERYQGSERDVIIYSFCVNRLHQLQFLSNLSQEDGVLIDRKLNVALTRSRKQLFLTGVPHLLAQNPIFNALLQATEKVTYSPKAR